MRHLITFILILLLASCTKEEVQPDCPSGLGVGDLLRLPDDTALTLVSVQDNRCPCGVECVWEGYLQAVLTDGDTTLRVSTQHVSDSLGIVDVVYYRQFPIAIDTVTLLTDACKPHYPQEAYCISFVLSDGE
ncbi:hypothetical protein GGR26_000155 [Lewinella marina]|uniref:Uncharacterized protein n=1 Tax=Neolewinella marina TaxID=438751 RepID=A0A2G0CK99_9BACT|nr:hypothetical protein [Neolewinella marina]NJB84410.1 hypothetical protein [Neolewinella marina]PHL00397.1 hypothetical protein CGL56_05010 [Neolewinella marina]